VIPWYRNTLGARLTASQSEFASNWTEFPPRIDRLRIDESIAPSQNAQRVEVVISGAFFGSRTVNGYPEVILTGACWALWT
jgi:hypothetical protein